MGGTASCHFYRSCSTMPSIWVKRKRSYCWRLTTFFAAQQALVWLWAQSRCQAWRLVTKDHAACLGLQHQLPTLRWSCTQNIRCQLPDIDCNMAASCHILSVASCKQSSRRLLLSLPFSFSSSWAQQQLCYQPGHLPAVCSYRETPWSCWSKLGGNGRPRLVWSCLVLSEIVALYRIVLSCLSSLLCKSPRR